LTTTAARPQARRRLWYDALALASLAAIAVTWWLLSHGDYVHDAYAYWSIDYRDMYGSSLVGRPATYLYSPAFAQLIWPATLLPWQIFASLWIGLNLVALTWMAGPILAALLLFIPHSPVTDEISTGNIHLLIGAAIVIGLRRPPALAFPLLTKVTPGVGVLWLAAANKWRPFAIAIGATVLICVVSFAISRDAWFDWMRLLTASSGVPVPSEASVIPGPLWLRTLLAAAVVVAGGRMQWRWTVPVAAVIALPVVWSSGLSVLVALVPLYRDRFPGWRDQLVGQVRRYRTSLSSR
jgi:hypothetical protein